MVSRLNWRIIGQISIIEVYCVFYQIALYSFLNRQFDRHVMKRVTYNTFEFLFNNWYIYLFRITFESKNAILTTNDNENNNKIRIFYIDLVSDFNLNVSNLFPWQFKWKMRILQNIIEYKWWKIWTDLN